MKDVFMQIVKLSLSAALIAGLVMLLRLALKKSPRFLVCALWALVAVRLLIPALPESRVSVMPQRISSGTVVEEVAARPVEPVVRITQKEPRYVKIIQMTPQIPVRYQGGEAYVEVSEKTLEAPKTVGTSILPVLAWIWLGGAVLMLAYMGFSYGRIWRKVRVSVRERDQIYICDGIASPFILGMFRPKIYIPSELPEKDKAYVLAHEQAHLKRLDHVWKPLGWLLLSLHWFNPVMWAAYILLCRDIELACDEKVTGREGDGYRKAYSEALLACSMPARLVTVCPLAFGEVGVKTRIRSVLNYKRPAFWILSVTLAGCIIVAGCALTDPTEPANTADPAVTSENNETPTDPSVQPTATEEPVTDPGPTDPAESGTPHEEVSGTPLISDQEGIMLAEFIARFFKADTEDASDLYYGEMCGLWLLDRSGRHLLKYTYDGVLNLSLDFIRDPRQVVTVFEKEGENAGNVIYITGSDALYRLPDADRVMSGKTAAAYEEIPLPEGVAGDDITDLLVYEFTESPVRTSAPVLITSRGNYLLQTARGTVDWRSTSWGYQLVWDDENTVTVTGDKNASWTLDMPGRDVRVLGPVSQDSLTLFVKEDDSTQGKVFFLDGEHVYESHIEMSGWSSIPDHFAFAQDGGVYVMAPQTDTIDVYRLTPGISSVYEEKDKEDLTSLRKDILGGKVVRLYDGKTVNENFPGFLLDMDGDGEPEEVGLTPGVGNHDAMTWELSLNGRPAGVSSLNYNMELKELLGLEDTEILWPEEGNFSRETPYKMYLASLDGKRITLFLESDEQTYGVEFVKIDANTVSAAGARTRIRGFGKSMEDFRPLQPLQDYIAEGWQVCPFEGDALDVTGDGTADVIHVTRSNPWGVSFPYMEWAAVNDAAPQPVSFEGFENGYADESGKVFRFGDLYYLLNDQGGYDVVGELAINGRTVVTCFRLADETARPLEPGEDFSRAGYHSIGGGFFPLPGWEGVEESVKRYYESARALHGDASAKDIAELQRLFRSEFADHFLLSAYPDVRAVNLEGLFYDGIMDTAFSVPGAPIPEAPEVRAALNDTMGLPLTKISRPEAEAAFLKYTGCTLDEAIGQMPGKYLEKFDAWYIISGDTARARYSIIDAYVNIDATVTALWRMKQFEHDLYGLVTVQKTPDGWHILANRFITEKELAGQAASGSLRAAGTKVLDYGSSDPRDYREIEWDGSPVLPVDFSYTSETGMLILDRLGKRLIYQNTMGWTGSAALDFCTDPERIAQYGDYIYILDGAEVLELKSDLYHFSVSSDAELLRRIPLPDGVEAEDVLDMNTVILPDTFEIALLLITGNQGNYLFREIRDAFEPTDLGWHMERHGATVTVRQDDLRWDLEITEEDVQVVDIRPYGNGTSLTLYVREKDADHAEIRRYDTGGRLDAVSRINLSDLVKRDMRLTGHGDPGCVMVHRFDGLYRYYIEPGVNHLYSEPLYFDLHTTDPREEEILQGGIVDLSFMKQVHAGSEKGIGFAIDMDQDGTMDTVSLESSMTPSGVPGLEFYYNGQPAGISRTLYGQGLITENEEAAFFRNDENYQFYLASLDGKTIDLIMSNGRRTLAVEFISLQSDIGSAKGGWFARVRMRGEGKTMDDFVPCRSIQKYLEEGWEVRPSDGDVIEIPGAGPQTLHVTYPWRVISSLGSFYRETIRVGDSPDAVTLGVIAGDYDTTYNRFDHLTYFSPEAGSSYTWLKGWMNDGSQTVYYGVSGNDGVLVYQEAEGIASQP